MLGAGSVRCPRPRCSAPLPRPPLSPPPPLLPAPALLRFSFCCPSHSLTPPCAGVPTRRRPCPPPPPKARPSHSAGDQCAARRPRGSRIAGSDRSRPARRQPGEGSREEAGAQASLLCEWGRREARGTRSFFSLQGEPGRFSMKEAQGLLLRREGWRAGLKEKGLGWRDPFLGHFSPTRKD